MRFGATLDARGATFRLWAPAARSVELVLDGEVLTAEASGAGWHAVRRDGAAAGARYRWRIDGDLLVPDPASRWNPDGPHGDSVLVDPAAFAWDDAGWPGRPWHDAVFYELHVGTCTPEGTYAAAAARLPALAALGVTAVQLMPLADFPGRFGWGYDGVLPFAPFHGYGDPDALKSFVQAAHRAGLMVFGDVVYNHFGPDGNFLHAYAPQFFTPPHRTAWGAGLNYDGAGSDVVREFVIANAVYWLTEYRFDGLRLDAVHAMADDSRPDILRELSTRVRAACTGRPVHLVLENDSNDETRLAAKPEPGRYDGQWSGEVHHPLHVLLTGETDGYYGEYRDPLRQLGRALAHGYSRQGGPHNSDNAPPRRDAEGSAPLGAIVNFVQTHDQVGNRAFGDRLAESADPRALRLALAIVCLAPSPPLLFMGEEWGAATPFRYFADWSGDLRDAVRQGRRDEFAQFPRYAAAAASGELPDPCSIETFRACKLDAVVLASTDDGRGWHAFVARLLATRLRALRPWLPALCADGHAATADGTLLTVDWRFDAGRILRMQANLAPEPCAVAPEFAGSDPIYTVGDRDSRGGDSRLGAWSGRWHWTKAAA